MKKDDVIAIDGPSASGKSTVARKVAAALSWLYVDSGALYRAVAWQTLQAGIDPADQDAVAVHVGTIDARFFVEEGAVLFEMAGERPGEALRRETVNQAVSPVAANAVVRERVTAWLRGMRSLGKLVMEGRDIGSVVFPAAAFKFYLDASPEERARRRHAESQDNLTVDAVGASLQRRDQIDSRRMTAPLTVAQDAQTIDSTGLGIDDVVAAILNRVRLS
ncbi:MAG: (d)CMP kinase [Kiritimatiellia bacterium]